MSNITGNCNCGKISLAIPKPTITALCHCTSCRRSGGAIASANFPVDPKDLQVNGSLSKYVANGSSGGPVTRYFCDTCGSPVYQVISKPNSVFVKAGLFDPGQLPQPALEMFVRNLESWEETYPGIQAQDTQ